jgi:Na+/H+ antiporter NhaD/arsenite permease-like protein
METYLSLAVFIISLGLIFTEKLDRTIATMLGAGMMLGVGTALGFYDEHLAVEAIDFETIGLLLGMMLLVALLEPTGFFQYLAVMAGRWSKGSPVRLLILLGTVTTVLSLFLDNVTTVVLIAPVTILISEVLGINPIPLLMAEALLSDTGGVGTLVGDPPNILIGSAAGLTFNDFLTHALPVAVVAWLLALGMLLFLFRQDLKVKPANVEAINRLNPEEALDDWPTARKVLIALGGAVLLFFLQDLVQLSPAYIAMTAATAALIWVRPAIRDVLQHVEWSVLLFFAGLFVMVGGLEHAGVLATIAGILTSFSHLNPVLFGIGLIWVVAILSALVDNVPITIAMIPVLLDLGGAGVDITPLWWALAFGAGFGGNATIIGSSANIVVASLSERTRTPITSALWSRRGLPVMIATCLAASVLYALFFPLFSR